MELRHLRYFAAVAELLNFSRAAERLHLSQPALSRQIRDLEDELGCALFLRDGSRITLTAAGRRMFEAARDLLARAEAHVSEVRRQARPEGERLRLGYMSWSWVDFCVQATQRLQKEFPRLDLSVHELHALGLLAALEAGEMDLALIGTSQADAGPTLATRCIGSFETLVALPAGHALAKHRRLGLGELRNEAWLVFSDKLFPGYLPMLENAADRAGFKPRIARKVETLGAMFLAVGAGLGVCLCSPLATKLKPKGVAFVHLKPPGAKARTHVAWRKTDRSPALQRLIVLLEEQGRIYFNPDSDEPAARGARSDVPAPHSK